MKTNVHVFNATKKNNKENFGWNLLFIECRFLLALKIIDLK